jgi:hypothetical protein
MMLGFPQSLRTIALVWPLPRAQVTKYFLHSTGKANSVRGNGTPWRRRTRFSMTRNIRLR